ncbi:dihydrolipoyl dehydrogenase family protein [Planctomicrobium piriforme]|uniref:Dihydrolipoamide dehydrogenase n=1 Tax=Planctomicrobium piriforme TaxID=1576369 RepID=A0A1I3SJE8_9PLAN|nr:NAD(P)/FAD-dependent oxidoreductase [Planctomicrobium piriforme]SFJ58795.1 dihydrolipoamide dehydrogenase [Planctomicrobium piriforme]
MTNSGARFDVIIIGAGPAGVVAALRAGDLGARTALISRGEFGGMAANDGPVPVRTLAHAARLLRDARQLGQYGITINEPSLDYDRLLVRVREVTRDVRTCSSWREQIKSLGVSVYECAGDVQFVDSHTIESGSGLRLEAKSFVICTGGSSRRLDVPGFEFTNTHSDAWSLSSVPSSMLVIGGGATGAQVASVFNAFGSRVQLFHRGPRILPTEDEDISAAVASAFRSAGIEVQENFGEIESFEKTPNGVRMNYCKDGVRYQAEASLAVVAIGWQANTAALRLQAAGVETDSKGFIVVDEYLRTTSPHILAAGDVTGRLLLVPPAIQDGFVAATNAVRGPMTTLPEAVNPIGSFTDPEYAQVGMTESQARATHDVLASTIHFDTTTRTIIDGRTFGFCKLVVDRATHKLLGCHVVGERAVEITQLAAIAMTAGMRVDEVARVPLSFPTYAGIFGRVAASVTRHLNQQETWQAN